MTALPVLLCSRAPTRICCRFQGIFGDGSGRAGRRGRRCRALEDVLSLTGKRGGLCSQHGAARGMAVRRCTVRALLRPHQRVRRGWRRGRSQQEPIEHAGRPGGRLAERQTQFPLGSKRPPLPSHEPISRIKDANVQQSWSLASLNPPFSLAVLTSLGVT